MSNGRSTGPSWWYCVFAVVAIAAGFANFAYTLGRGLGHLTDHLIQIVVPGEKDVTLEPKLNYTIFLETQSVVAGKIYSTERVSGLNCTVTSETTGDKIATRSSVTNMSYTVAGRKGTAVLEFSTEEAGQYRVGCAYDSGAQGPEVVVAVGSGVGGRIGSIVGVSLASMFGGFIVGAAILITIAVLRARAKARIVRLNHSPI